MFNCLPPVELLAKFNLTWAVVLRSCGGSYLVPPTCWRDCRYNGGHCHYRYVCKTPAIIYLYLLLGMLLVATPDS